MPLSLKFFSRAISLFFGRVRVFNTFGIDNYHRYFRLAPAYHPPGQDQLPQNTIKQRGFPVFSRRASYLAVVVHDVPLGETMRQTALGTAFFENVQNCAKNVIQIIFSGMRRLSGRFQIVFYHRKLFPVDAAWINCSHTVSAFSVVLFHFTSAYVFCKDVEQVLTGVPVPA
jgi:hypothetical protein